MSVSLSITLKTFEFLTVFVALVGTIDAGGTSSGFKGSEPPLLKPDKHKKTLTYKMHCNYWSKIRFLFRLNSKILGGGGRVGMIISKIIFFL